MVANMSDGVHDSAQDKDASDSICLLINSNSS